MERPEAYVKLDWLDALRAQREAHDQEQQRAMERMCREIYQRLKKN